MAVVPGKSLAPVSYTTPLASWRFGECYMRCFSYKSSMAPGPLDVELPIVRVEAAARGQLFL